MSRLSIIVPLLGDQNLFDDTLASVLRYRPEDSQVIVVHDGHYDDPHELGNEVKLVSADENRLSCQINVGLCYVAAELTVLVRPGIEVDENWHAELYEIFQDTNVAAVSPAIVSKSKPNRTVCQGIVADRTWSRRVVGRGARLFSRSSNSRLQSGPTSWLAAYRTSVLKCLAPLDEQIQDLFLDVDIFLSLQSLGLKCSYCADFVGTVETAEMMVDETLSAHGVDAQRAEARYGQKSAFNRLKHSLFDLLQVPVSRWRMTHALQRWAGTDKRTIDQAHGMKLAKLKLSRPWESITPQVNQDAADWLSERRAA